MNRSRHINRRGFNQAALGATLFYPLTASKTIAAPQAKCPNILLIFTDQQSVKAMSAFGNRFVNTPNMDALATGGASFERSYCAAPVCGPSRSSWVTGLMPHQTGVNYNGDVIREGVPTMGELFRSAGYDTAWSGKWHLPESYPAIPRPWKKNDTTKPIPGFEVLPMNGDPKKMYPFGDFADDPAADSAIEFIRRERNKPFLLGVSLHNPHDICHEIMGSLSEDHPSHRDAPPASLDGYPPLPDNFKRDPDEPEIMTLGRNNDKYGRENTYTHEWPETRWRTYLYEYYRMTERVDRVIGRILDALSESELDDDTLVLFTSDHGEGMAAHEWVVKLNLYEEVASVPFALRWKGVIPQCPIDSRRLVSGADILPTIADYAGIQLPSKVTGMSLRPLIENQSVKGRDYVVTELASDKYNHDLTGRMVRSERYKYMAFSQGENAEMLFDLEDDPGETTNLISSTAMRAVADRHRAMLNEYIDRTDDYFAMARGS